MMRPVAGEVKMNRAESSEPKAGHKMPAAAGKSASSEAGGMGSANMSGAFSSAVSELKSQHPHAHYEHGPHHGTQTHIRHQRTVVK